MFTHKQLFDLVSRNIRMETLMKNAMDLNAWENDPGYANFEKSAEVCVQALKEAGFSNIEKIACKCDGVTAAMDHTMPQAWDRTGRCTLEIISGKMPKAKRLLCDSDRDPLEAGLWSPSTPEEGLTGEVVPGEENANVAGKYVYTPDPPKNKQMIAWSRGGAAHCTLQPCLPWHLRGRPRTILPGIGKGHWPKGDADDARIQFLQHERYQWRI